VWLSSSLPAQYRGSEKVAEMTGAKVDKLKELIAAQLAA
jgi:hypothetical protein